MVETNKSSSLTCVKIKTMKHLLGPGPDGYIGVDIIGNIPVRTGPLMIDPPLTRNQMEDIIEEVDTIGYENDMVKVFYMPIVRQSGGELVISYVVKDGEWVREEEFHKFITGNSDDS